MKHIVRNMTPWRMAGCARAYATIELAAGTLERHDVKVGDRLCLGASVSMKMSA